MWGQGHAICPGAGQGSQIRNLQAGLLGEWPLQLTAGERMMCPAVGSCHVQGLEFHLKTMGSWSFMQQIDTSVLKCHLATARGGIKEDQSWKQSAGQQAHLQASGHGDLLGGRRRQTRDECGVRVHRTCLQKVLG